MAIPKLVSLRVRNEDQGSVVLEGDAFHCELGEIIKTQEADEGEHNLCYHTTLPETDVVERGAIEVIPQQRERKLFTRCLSSQDCVKAFIPSAVSEKSLEKNLATLLLESLAKHPR